VGKKTGRRGNGEGTVDHMKDGRWQARITLPDGRRKAFYGKTRKEAVDKMTAAISARDRGLPIVGERVTVRQFLDRWVEDVARPAVRPSTFTSYKMHVSSHWNKALGNVALAKLTPGMIQQVLTKWQAAGVSAATIQRRRATLRCALGQAEDWGLIPRNPAKLVNPPRVEHKPVVPLTPDQARVMLDAIKGDRQETLYYVALALGLRQGEVLGLTWSDIDFAAATLSVRHALQRIDGKLQHVEPKSRKSRRTIPLPPVIITRLREHRAAQNRERLAAGDRWKGNELGLVFTTTIGTPVHGPVVTKRFQDMLKRAGLPRQKFHNLRHSCASFLLAEGLDLRHVADILGHEDPSLTLRVYAHTMPARARASADAMEKLLGGTG